MVLFLCFVLAYGLSSDHLLSSALPISRMYNNQAITAKITAFKSTVGNTIDSNISPLGSLEETAAKIGDTAYNFATNMASVIVTADSRSDSQKNKPIEIALQKMESNMKTLDNSRP